VDRRRVPVPRARERATSCSGGGARTPVRTQPTLIMNDLAVSPAHRYPRSLTGSVTTIVTVFFGGFRDRIQG
jgi:hypothetical protein